MKVGRSLLKRCSPFKVGRGDCGGWPGKREEKEKGKEEATLKGKQLFDSTLRGRRL